MYDPKVVAEYIRQAAIQRGIDPAVALRVAQAEGLNAYVGDGGSSFGPFQLHYGGVARGGNAVGGLGDVFTKRTGLDARNPDTWRQQVDFSLDEAKRGGWGPWHAWKGGSKAGIGGQPANMPASGGDAMPVDGMSLSAPPAASPDAGSDPIAELLAQLGGGGKKRDPIAGLLSSLSPQEEEKPDADAFARQIRDFHNAQHMRAVQGLL